MSEKSNPVSPVLRELGDLKKINKRRKGNSAWLVPFCVAAFLGLGMENANAGCRVLNGATVPVRTLHRSLYFSSQASRIGDLTLTSQFVDIIGDTTNENLLLEYIVRNKIDALTFYDLNNLFASSTLTSRLSSFILAAKACGVVDMIAVGRLSSDWVAIKKYQNANAGTFTGVVTEIEFWNAPSGQVGTAFNSFLSMLKYIRSLAITDHGTPIKIAPYLGWFNSVPGLTTKQVAAQIAPLIDRLYLHCYVQNGANTFNYCKGRIQDFISAGKVLEFYPIFSAEGAKYNAGSGGFMGDWLAANSIQSAENLFYSAFTSTFGTSSSLRLKGFQYYEYVFLNHYLPY